MAEPHGAPSRSANLCNPFVPSRGGPGATIRVKTTLAFRTVSRAMGASAGVPALAPWSSSRHCQCDSVDELDLKDLTQTQRCPVPNIGDIERAVGAERHAGRDD
jgi:hypothetical protein